MEKKDLSAVRRLMDGGFYYDNLKEMARICREVTSPAQTLTAFVVHHVFLELAGRIGEGPVLITEIRKLEAKYRTMINLTLEEAIEEVQADRQVARLTNLIHLHWGANSP